MRGRWISLWLFLTSMCVSLHQPSAIIYDTKTDVSRALIVSKLTLFWQTLDDHLAAFDG